MHYYYFCYVKNVIQCTNYEIMVIVVSPHIFCLSSGLNKQGSLKSILEHVQSYEITYPLWLHPHRHRRSANKEVSQSVSLSVCFTIKMTKKHAETFKSWYKSAIVQWTPAAYLCVCPCSIQQRHRFWSQLRVRSSDYTWRKTSEWFYKNKMCCSILSVGLEELF